MNTQKTSFLVVLLATLFLLTACSDSDNDSVTKIESDLIEKLGTLSVEDTVKKIESIIDANEDLGIFTIINHQVAAQKVGLEMSEEQVIIFGNPKLGTNIMNIDQRTGLDLPLKILVFKADNNQTKIVYRDPAIWKNGFDLGDTPLVETMANALNAITTGAQE